MAPVAKPNALTRKLGPAPVWAWAAAGLILAWLIFLRPPPSARASQTTQAPVTGTTAGVPDTGAAANGNAAGDLLAQLLQGQQSVIDKLAGGLLGGGQGSTGAAAGASATSAAATASPDSGIAPSSPAPNGPAAAPYINDPTLSTVPTNPPPADYVNDPGLSTVVLGSAASSVTPGDFSRSGTTSPTPVTVTPSPVDTGSLAASNTRLVAV